MDQLIDLIYTPLSEWQEGAWPAFAMETAFPSRRLSAQTKSFPGRTAA